MNQPTPPDPRDPALFSSIVLRVPRATKNLYVATARAQGLTLAAWILARLDESAGAIKTAQIDAQPQKKPPA